jgi:serine beta-lactamase-like protein LACTB, mitochondrial
MKIVHIAFILFVLVFILGCKKTDVDQGNYKYSVTTWQGTDTYDARYKGAIEKSRNLITEANRLNGLPGAQIAVAVDGKICWSENFGFADLNEGRPVRSTTLFRMASVSKLITAVAVGKLVEEGKLDLDKPITAYLPELPDHYKNITTRHLVSHQSGIRHYYGADRSEKTEHYNDVRDALAVFVDAPLLFPPGQNSEYSSYAWVVVSAIIQKLAGKPFLDYMRDEIWTPLGLKNTFGEIPLDRTNDITKFYLKDAPQSSWTEASFQDLSFNWAGAGLTSTATDLAQLGNKLLNGNFLKKETVDLLFTPQLTARKDTIGFGIGFTLYAADNGEQIIGHGGFMPTARSYLLMFPKENSVVAFTCNTAMTNFSDENLLAIAHMFMKENERENFFLFDRNHHVSWKGLWKIEMERDADQYDTAYLNFYEDGTALSGTLLDGNLQPRSVEITSVSADTLEFLMILQSHTADVQLIRAHDKISGTARFNKPLPYLFKKRLANEPQIANMLRPKKIRNGERLK